MSDSNTLVRAETYITMVRATLENTAFAWEWDLFLQRDTIQQLEQVQHVRLPRLHEIQELP